MPSRPSRPENRHNSQEPSFQDSAGSAGPGMARCAARGAPPDSPHPGARTVAGRGCARAPASCRRGARGEQTTLPAPSALSPGPERAGEPVSRAHVSPILPPGNRVHSRRCARPCSLKATPVAAARKPALVGRRGPHSPSHLALQILGPREGTLSAPGG